MWFYIMYLLQVSVGTLLAFTIVAVCLLILRYVPPSEVSEVLQSLPGSSTAMEEYGSSSGSTGPILHKDIIDTIEEELQMPDSPPSATSGLSQNRMLLQEQANLAGIVHPLQVCVCPVYTAIVCGYLGSTWVSTGVHVQVPIIHPASITAFNIGIDSHMIFAQIPLQNSMISPLYLWTFYEYFQYHDPSEFNSKLFLQHPYHLVYENTNTCTTLVCFYMCVSNVWGCCG